jgi:hypothetical protein
MQGEQLSNSVPPKPLPIPQTLKSQICPVATWEVAPNKASGRKQGSHHPDTLITGGKNKNLRQKSKLWGTTPRGRARAGLGFCLCFSDFQILNNVIQLLLQ